ncbi:hypothetical protein C8R46DRAFT_1062743 [Mycena filopes]|nr:hypothetical protein C8R46DRAFT_1149495 [Mycena filopes]KAJ7186198.1 hypothetical protein C8R46DRAFT_1062743 [Mycena filopes]
MLVETPRRVERLGMWPSLPFNVRLNKSSLADAQLSVPPSPGLYLPSLQCPLTVRRNSACPRAPAPSVVVNNLSGRVTASRFYISPLTVVRVRFPACQNPAEVTCSAVRCTTTYYDLGLPRLVALPPDFCFGLTHTSIPGATAKGRTGANPHADCLSRHRTDRIPSGLRWCVPHQYTTFARSTRARSISKYCCSFFLPKVLLRDP